MQNSKTKDLLQTGLLFLNSFFDLMAYFVKVALTVVQYMVASGALAFDGLGWFWERRLVKLGFIKPELFTVVLKTLTYQPLKGNLRWWKPWTCVALIKGGTVNKVIDKWIKKIEPKLNYSLYPVVVSIYGTKEELVLMAKMLNRFPIKAIEVNYSCPNTGHGLTMAEAVIDVIKAVAQASRHPVIVKVSVVQNYLEIANGLKGIAQAISINSVPWEKAFPRNKKSPLHRLEKRVGGGGGGVSGKPAQALNWEAVEKLADQKVLPVIGPSIMEFEDMERLRRLGASAFSFGAIHLPTYPLIFNLLSIFRNPCKPTQIVRRRENKK